MRIADIKLGKRGRHELGDIEGLMASIQDVGLLQPIVVRPDKQLVAGARRLEACKRLAWTDIPVHQVDNLTDALRLLKAERDENVQRKALTPEEAVDQGAEIQPLEEAEAARRQQATRHQTAEQPVRESFPDGSAGRSLDKVAAGVGMSRRTYEKAKKVVEAARTDPDKYGELLGEMNASNRVNGVYKKLETQRQAEQISKEPPPLPTGPFRLIAADPPWQYEGRVDDASHRVANPYPTMSIDEIKALGTRIRQMAHEDAILWLWTTNAHMREAFEVLDAWGFQHKTILTWVKDRMGVGDWLRGKTEHCLMAVRGKPAVRLTNQTTVLEAANEGHSAKPDAFYKMVEGLCPAPDRGRLEMFARESRDGWIVWGNKVNTDAS